MSTEEVQQTELGSTLPVPSKVVKAKKNRQSFSPTPIHLRKNELFFIYINPS